MLLGCLANKTKQKQNVTQYADNRTVSSHHVPVPDWLQDFKTLFLSLEARKIFLRSREWQIQTYTLVQTQTQDTPTNNSPTRHTHKQQPPPPLLQPPPPSHTHTQACIMPVYRCEDISCLTNVFHVVLCPYKHACRIQLLLLVILFIFILFYLLSSLSSSPFFSVVISLPVRLLLLHKSGCQWFVVYFSIEAFAPVRAVTEQHCEHRWLSLLSGSGSGSCYLGDNDIWIICHEFIKWAMCSSDELVGHVIIKWDVCHVVTWGVVKCLIWKPFCAGFQAWGLRPGEICGVVHA